MPKRLIISEKIKYHTSGDFRNMSETEVPVHHSSKFSQDAVDAYAKKIVAGSFLNTEKNRKIREKSFRQDHFLKKIITNVRHVLIPPRRTQ